jgi:endonuclease/exonuclease/phosphatase (EEP) superfamily protein YafD
VLRLLGILVTVLCAIATAVVTWPGFFHVERHFPVAQIVAFRAGLIAVFGLSLIGLLLLMIPRATRGFAGSLAIVATIGLIANAGILALRGLGTDGLPAKTDESIRVLTWNTAGSDATAPDSIAQIAVAMDADIVALPETTIETGEKVAIAMRELGHRMWAHHTEYGVDGWDASSTTLLISPRLGDYSVIEASATGTSRVPSAVAMPIGGEGPIVVAAHAVAPRRDDMQHWRDDLQWLADQCGDSDVIMAGDFNATVDHMAGLGVDDGTLGRCRDVAVETGNGAVGTWPTDMPALTGAPIDHVLVSEDWRASGSLVLRSLDGSGSDHRPLVVQIEPAD